MSEDTPPDVTPEPAATRPAGNRMSRPIPETPMASCSFLRSRESSAYRFQ